MKDFLVPMITVFVVGVLSAISSPYKAKADETGGFLLRYPTPTKTLGAGFLIISVVCVSMFVHKFNLIGIEKLATLILGAMLVISLPLSLFIEFFYARYYINDELICSNTPWSKKKSIYWKDVRTIYYCESFRWFVIKDNTKTIHVGELISGIDSLLKIAQANTKEGVCQKFK